MKTTSPGRQLSQHQCWPRDRQFPAMLDLFSSVPKTCGKVEYTGRMGCALDKSSGIFIDVNINDENNVESLCSYVKTFVEDING